MVTSNCPRVKFPWGFCTMKSTFEGQRRWFWSISHIQVALCGSNKKNLSLMGEATYQFGEGFCLSTCINHMFFLLDTCLCWHMFCYVFMYESFWYSSSNWMGLKNRCCRRGESRLDSQRLGAEHFYKGWPCGKWRWCTTHRMTHDSAWDTPWSLLKQHIQNRFTSWQNRTVLFFLLRSSFLPEKTVKTRKVLLLLRKKIIHLNLATNQTHRLNGSTFFIEPGRLDPSFLPQSLCHKKPVFFCFEYHWLSDGFSLGSIVWETNQM